MSPRKIKRVALRLQGISSSIVTRARAVLEGASTCSREAMEPRDGASSFTRVGQYRQGRRVLFVTCSDSVMLRGCRFSRYNDGPWLYRGRA